MPQASLSDNCTYLTLLTAPSSDMFPCQCQCQDLTHNRTIFRVSCCNHPFDVVMLGLVDPTRGDISPGEEQRIDSFIGPTNLKGG